MDSGNADTPVAQEVKWANDFLGGATKRSLRPRPDRWRLLRGLPVTGSGSPVIGGG